MTPSAPQHVPVARPSRGQQLAAGAALVLLAAAVAFLAGAAASRWQAVLAGGLALGLAVLGAWEALTRRGPARWLAVAVAAGGLLLFAVVLVRSESLRVIAVVVALAAGSVAAAQVALRAPSGAAPVDPADPADPAPGAPRPRHAVLLMNPKSGGGKAQRFELADRCRERGIEPIVLKLGDDLLALAEDAVARGADLIGMAGGDGSQALVASVAARHGVPHVVIPAGTRNHFALDLGLDRDDVVGALDAYGDGVDRVIDLAEVNGRVFVNNASMGVYAEVVQSAEYRDAKVATAAAMLPEIIGPGATPMDLRFTLPSGDEATTAQLILVSNNPYDLHHLRGGGTRERIDGGVLGVVSVQVNGAGDAERLAALEATGGVRRFAGWSEWTTSAFEVRSAAPVHIGVDGEALSLEPPLRFTIRPGALTVRLPRHALGVSPTARTVRPAERATVVALARTAVGQPTGAR